jgi:hypothetical protein
MKVRYSTTPGAESDPGDGTVIILDPSAWITVDLTPKPSAVEYPESSPHTAIPTVDGATVIQRPLVDTRVRRWLWYNYPRSHQEFASLWSLLESLETRTRFDQGLTPWVYVWEDLSGTGRFDRKVAGDEIFSRVRVVRVERTARPGGGPVIYDRAAFEFRVEDAYFNR